MIATHLLDIFVLALWMALVGLALRGWGELLRRGLKVDLTQEASSNSIPSNPALLDVWLGISLCITLTELLHFFFPITWLVSLGLLGVGFVYSLTLGALQHPHRLFHKFAANPPSMTTWLYILAALATIFMWLSVAMSGSTNYDSGLYHFGSIKWLNEHSVTYGIVNLHTRLAYNQSYFALIALLNFSPFYEQAYAGTGVFLFILAAATCIQLVHTAVSQPLLLFSGLLVLAGAFVLKTSSPSPDLAVGLFQLVVFFTLFIVLLDRGSQYHLTVLLVLCVTALTLKLSMAVFCAAALGLGYRQFWDLQKTNRALVWRLILLCAFILGIHAARGYALSGVPFYPSTLAGAWALPYTPSPARVVAEAQSIYSWARLPVTPTDTVLSGWTWLAPWFSALPARFSILTGLALTLLGLNLCLLGFGVSTSQPKRIYRLYVPFVLGFVFWFFTAPDVRFLGLIPELTVLLGCWLFWSAIRQPLVQHLQQHRKYYRVAGLASFVLLIVITLLYALKIKTGLGLASYFYVTDVLYGLSQIGIDASFFVALVMGLLLLKYQAKFLQHTQRTTGVSLRAHVGYTALTALFLCSVVGYAANLALFKPNELKGWVDVPREPYDQEQLQSGLRVNVPKSDDLCWQTPLPCLPRQQLSQQLELIKPAALLNDLSASKEWPAVQFFKKTP